MQQFLGTLGGSNLGSAIRRILRRVATNDVLGQYSLQGRRAEKAFQQLNLCMIITAACVKNYPDRKVAEIEDGIAQVLKFAPHRWIVRQRRKFKMSDYDSDDEVPFTLEPKGYLYEPEHTEKELLQMATERNTEEEGQSL